MGGTGSTLIAWLVVAASIYMWTLAALPLRPREPGYYATEYGVRIVAVAPFREQPTVVANDEEGFAVSARPSADWNRSTSYVVAIVVASKPFLLALVLGAYATKPWTFFER
jgi:hypothetical protein